MPGALVRISWPHAVCKLNASLASNQSSYRKCYKMFILLVQEITLSNLSQHDVVPLLDLLPKLLKIHLVVDGSKEDQSFSNITKKLSELATLAKLTVRATSKSYHIEIMVSSPRAFYKPMNQLSCKKSKWRFSCSFMPLNDKTDFNFHG